MRTRRAIPALVLIAALAGAACESTAPPGGAVPAPAAAPTATPPLRFATGEVHRVRSVSSSSVVPTDPRMAAFAFTSVEEVEVTQRVVEVLADGTGVIDVSFDAAAVRVSVPKLNYAAAVDTRDPASMERWKSKSRDDPMLHGLAPLIDRVGTMLIRFEARPDGTVGESRVVRDHDGREVAGSDGAFGLLGLMQVWGWIAPVPAEAAAGSGEVAIDDGRGLVLIRGRSDRDASLPELIRFHGSVDLDGLLRTAGPGGVGMGGMSIRDVTLQSMAAASGGRWESVRHGIRGEVALPKDARFAPDMKPLEFHLDLTIDRIE